MTADIDLKPSQVEGMDPCSTFADYAEATRWPPVNHPCAHARKLALDGRGIAPQCVGGCTGMRKP